MGVVDSNEDPMGSSKARDTHSNQEHRRPIIKMKVKLKVPISKRKLRWRPLTKMKMKKRTSSIK